MSRLNLVRVVLYGATAIAAVVSHIALNYNRWEAFSQLFH